MQSVFEAAINQICEEKHLDKDVVIFAIEAALAAAYRKEYGSEHQKLMAKFDLKTGEAIMFQIFEVVEEVEYEENQLTLKDAKKINKKIELGGRIEQKIDLGDKKVEYGRIAAQTAKQVIIQRLQEAERDAIYSRYKDQQGEIINAQVQRVEANHYVFLSIDGATVPLYPTEQIQREKYYIGQRLKVYIAKVERTSKAPAIIVSRTHHKFIEKLLELEVPEIRENSIAIETLVREAGVRTKIAVKAVAEGIDPVGSCVGQRGVRIQAVTTEIGEEKIDIIEYSDNIIQMIINSLSPAKITSIDLDERRKCAKVYVLEDQRSLAIGKNGQNVRLASKLIGWEIDIVNFVLGETTVKTLDEIQDEEDAKSVKQEDVSTEKEDATNVSNISSLKSVSKKIAITLEEAGIDTIDILKEKTAEELVELPGIGVKTAQKILDEAKG